jgi:hypothetical protein
MITTVVVGLLGSAMLCHQEGLPSAPSQHSNCLISLEIQGEIFPSSHAVSVTLKSLGPEIIYLPGSWPRGVRVQRKLGQEWIPGELHPRGEDIYADPLVYRFDQQQLLATVWGDVAQRREGSTFWVLPGRYRLVLEFTLANPVDSKGEGIQECFAISDEFELLNESSWTRYEE